MGVKSGTVNPRILTDLSDSNLLQVILFQKCAQCLLDLPVRGLIMLILSCIHNPPLFKNWTHVVNLMVD